MIKIFLKELIMKYLWHGVLLYGLKVVKITQ